APVPTAAPPAGSAGGAAAGGDAGREAAGGQLNPWPGYVADRLSLYEQLKRESDALLAKKAADSKPITVELPDGQKVAGKAWVTTPYQLACDIRDRR
uniref:TGS domain-containing protein n=1 Tax=Acanthochromis polyacanthus TaxID=80966 RepID=A0A3Q1GS37_9TELE